MNLIGQTLGQYQIVELIGTGGMASVYKAHQPSLDRYVAIKVLPAQHALTPGYKDRFILEAKAVAQLSHPNILPIYDFGFEGDLSYFVMKYVPDHTLGQLLGQPMDLVKMSHFINQIAGALDHAHSRGILHRDIKPANMLLEGDWLLLADFGVAKIMEASNSITTTGHIFGSPAYVSPEQAEGDPLDHRTDIYSLGVVLYEMVTGQVPFQDANPMRVILKHIHEPPPAPRSRRPDLSEALEQIILKAMSKESAARFNSAQELAHAWQQVVTPSALLAGRSLTTIHPEKSTEKPAATPVSRSRYQVAAQVSGNQLTEKSKPLQPSLHAIEESRRSASSLGKGLVGGILLLSLVGALIFFSTSRADQAVSATTTSTLVTSTSQLAHATPTATLTPATQTAITASPSAASSFQAIVTSSTPSVSPTPATATPTPVPTVTPRLPQASLPTIDGVLAIPVKFGPESKVYVTGFDGAGVNGPTPVSLGHARQPIFRPDGQALMVNGATNDGVLRGIFVTDRQGQAPNPLNDRGQAYWPVWSPQGDEIIFADLNQGRVLFRQASQLAKMEADYQPFQVKSATIAGNNLVWADDNRLVFQGCAEWQGQAGECGIWITPTDVIRPVRLTSVNGLPMDAKQGQLVYVLAEGGDWDIYLMSLEGGQPTNLTNNTSQDGLPALAPDGRTIAYLSNESGTWAVWTIILSNQHKQKWFDLDPQRGLIDVKTWTEERMSWTW